MSLLKLGLGLACLVVATGLLAQQPPRGGPQGVTIVITNEGKNSKYVDISKFVPGGKNKQEPVTVKVGQKVVWENHDTMPHTATSDKDGVFDTGGIKKKGNSKEITFTRERFQKAGGKAGQSVTINYHCDYHDTMKGAQIILRDN